MDAELVNMYMQRLLKEVDDLTKNRLLLETRISYTESLNIELSKKVEELEAQLEKLGKRKKEVDTSSSF
mgnify:CR=1 FL=1